MAEKKTYDPVFDYVTRVLAGEIVASRWVKMACQRHLDDIERAEKTKCFTWDIEGAKLYLDFFVDVLRLNGGEFEGKPFVLEPWQQFVVGSIFGWNMPDGFRRFNIAFLEVGKGNGKSPMSGAIAIEMLTIDKEARAEIYSCAADQEQAKVLFRDAVAMVEQSPELSQRIIPSGLGENTWNLAYRDTGSWFRTWSKERRGKSGFRPHGAFVDEVHEHADATLINMLLFGFKGRRQPLLFMTTNSGTDRESVCYHYHNYITKILKQTAHNDRMFGFICALDSCEEHWLDGQEQPVDNCSQCDDWRVEGSHWEKANPNLGVSIRAQTIRDDVERAAEMPSQENECRRLHFCYWTSSSTRWLSMQAWDGCGGAIDYEQLRGRSCIIGLDLANKIDIAALVLLFMPDRLALVPAPKIVNADGDTGQREDNVNYSTVDIERLDEDFIVLPYFFIPKDTIIEAMRRDNVPYDVWVRQGLIEATEGNVIDYRAIEQKIVALKEIYPIRSKWENNATFHLFGCDPWNATQFANDMRARYGVNMIEVRQGYQTMSEPTKEMARLIKAKKLRHGGNPVLRWMADNMVVRQDPAGNLKPDKEKSKYKIDGVVAMIIAFALAIRNAQAGHNVYNDRARAGDGAIVRSL